MQKLQLALAIFLFIIINVVYYKSRRLDTLRRKINNIFWVDEIADSQKSHIFAYKPLNFFVKFFMHFYITTISLFITNAIVYFNLELILGVVVIGIIFPLMYRLVMGFQRKIHGI